jgi:hypothetical protein
MEQKADGELTDVLLLVVVVVVFCLFVCITHGHQTADSPAFEHRLVLATLQGHPGL